MFAELDKNSVVQSGDDRKKPASWRMDENTPVTAIPADTGHGLPYGRRGKTGQTIYLNMRALFYVTIIYRNLHHHKNILKYC